ncbi:MAG: formate dehydrogenase subunit alpha [Candidatus Heimdallarchaeota archaeon]|nr:formate dehydrogenase subunit alpha [Candidatus Heimdallarchaeota archaeon]
MNIVVDGKEILAFPGETYLQAIQRAGIYIPTLCYEKELVASGSCRLCVIEQEGLEKLLPSCTTMVQEGTRIRTSSERVIKAREVLLELIIADHPLDCMVCEKQGNCTLQKLAYEYVPREKLKRMAGKSVPKGLHEKNEFFTLNYDMCIRCGKCVQAVDEIQVCGVLSMQGRGVEVYPTPGFDRNFRDAGCVGCGNCVAVCPVAALVPNTLIEQHVREVESKRTVTTCNYCGVGCQFELVHKDNRIIYVDSHRDAVVNGLALCVKGRYGWDYIHHPDRIDTPLIKKGGKFVKASWQEAFDFIESKMKTIQHEFGSEAFAFLSSAKATNESNYLMQKMARAAFKTNSVDHCARLCHASTVAGLAQTFGSGAMTNSIADVTEQAEVIFIIGSNITEAHPVMGIKVKQGVQQGKIKVITADPRKIEITEYSEYHLQHKPGTDLALIIAMIKVIVDEGLVNEEFINNRTEGFDELKEMLASQDLDLLAKIASVPLDKIKAAARLYASVERAAIIYAMGITQHFTGTFNVGALANLAMITGNIGRPGTGVNPLRGQNNVQGACDLGALPDVYPGYQKVHLSESKKKFEEAWGTDLSDKPGLTVTEIMSAAYEGTVKSLWIMGENPVLSDPNIEKVIKALEKVDFLVVQDLFITDTAEYADVVLPAKSFAETDGTYTNTERRVQFVNKAIDQVGGRWDDWWILNEMLIRWGFDKRYHHPSEIMDEIKQITPIYGGISYNRIGHDGLQWPCPTDEHQGTPILHTGTFSRGKGKFLVSPFINPAEMPDQEYPFILTTGRSLYHWHTGSQTRRSKGLDERKSEERSEINTNDAKRLGIKNGERIRLTSRRGTLETLAFVTDRVMEGVIFMTFHFRESAANLLTNDALDPTAKIPELKVAAIKVEKI